MSALSTFTAANRVIDSGKAVTYSKTRVPGSWTYSSGVGVTTTINNAWQYVRHCTKTYRYVGLSKEAATKCVTKKIARFNRAVKISSVKSTTVTSGDVFEDISGGTAVMARIEARYNGAGQLWTVCISVDEIDTKMRSSGTDSPSSLFTAEDARGYDDSQQWDDEDNA